jgi:hypothetical protein
MIESRQDRTALLAQLAEHPAWEALKEILRPALAHKRLNFDDPQWAGRMAYEQGRCDMALDAIKAVDRAAETIKQQRLKEMSV